jgi:hypothetical protein
MMYAAQWDSFDVMEVEADGLFGSDWGKGSRMVAMWVDGVFVWEWWKLW